MNRLVGWHTRAGEIGLRLLQLHLLWLGWTLLGGVVLGLFPATAAVYAVVRRDALRGDDAGDRAPLRHEFRSFWKEGFASANALGYVVAVLWALLLLDRQLVATVDMGAAGPAAAGLLWVLSAFLFTMTASLGVLSAHFAEGPLSVLRRSAILVVARPKQAVFNAVVVGVVLCLYYVVPGIVPVFGLALPAYLSFTYLWQSGLLPAPAATGSVRTTPVAA